jgi:hypothetical protein
MSSQLFKTDINNILPITTTENNNALSNIKIVSKNNSELSATSSAFMSNINTVTSSANMSQMVGGNYNLSETSNLHSDINNLVSMLTSDSHMNTIKNSTPSLENKLRKLLNQDGGNFNDEINTDELEDKIYNVVKQNGGKNDLIKLGLAASGAYLAYNLLQPQSNHTETETELNVSKILNLKQPIQVATPQVNLPSNVNPLSDSQTSESSTSAFTEQSNKNVFIKNNLSQGQGQITTTDAPVSSTSSFMPVDSRLQQLRNSNPMVGGDDSDMLGGNNPALIAFRSIVKNIVEKLGIKYNKALKVASKLQNDVKSKNSNISHEKLAEAAQKHLEQNMSTYKDFAKTI